MAPTTSTGGVRARTGSAGLPHRTRRHATSLGGKIEKPVRYTPSLGFICREIFGERFQL